MPQETTPIAQVTEPQNKILLTEFLQEQFFKQFQDVRIDPTDNFFEWKVYLHSESRMLGKVSVERITGTNDVENAKKLLEEQVSQLLRDNGIDEAGRN
jgi:hypothetical protein